MRRINFMIAAITAVLWGCGDGPGYTKIAPRGIFLYPIANDTSVRCISPHKAGTLEFGLDIMHSHDTYLQWNESNGIEESLEEQWKQHLGRPFEPEEAVEFIYAQLTDAVITADCEVAGKTAGENLADLFSLSIGEPTFRFPNGEWVDFPAGVEVITLEDFIDGNYLCPDDLYIYSDIGKDTEEYKTVNFSVVLTLSDGTNEKTLTSNCTLEI